VPQKKVAYEALAAQGQYYLLHATDEAQSIGKCSLGRALHHGRQRTKKTQMYALVRVQKTQREAACHDSHVSAMIKELLLCVCDKATSMAFFWTR
jgi:hypothetical protein